MVSQVVQNYDNVRSQLALHARPEISPQIIVVTKNQPVHLIKQLIAHLPRPIFGENRIQEALPKIEACQTASQSVEWHFIGTLQRNKVKRALGRFSLIQSLDRLSLAKEIDKRAEQQNIDHVNCLLQIDVSRDGSKSGVIADIDTIKQFLRQCEELSRLQILGLMTMAPWLPPEETRPYFKQMAQIFLTLQGLSLPSNVRMEILSMGMSNDYYVAVQEGANMIRLGTVLFGK